MARKRSSTADDFMDIIAILLWWAGCMLALVIYLVLHRVATQEMAANVSPGQVGTLMVQGIWRAVAMVGQLLVPVLFLQGLAMAAHATNPAGKYLHRSLLLSWSNNWG